MSVGAAWGSIVSLAVFVLLLAPPGYWLLHRLDGTEPRARDLGLALGLGLTAVLPLLWLERIVGFPVLVLPATVLASIALRRHWRAWAREPVGPLFVAVPAALGLFAFLVNAGDVRWEAGAASIRLGFEMADRAFYGLVAQEVLRDPTPALQNPLFAGFTFAYSYFPSLAGLLLHLYGGRDLLSVFQLHLCVVSFVFIGLAIDRTLAEFGVTSPLARLLTAVLCVLGGDLSYVFPAAGVRGAERAAHFLAFCSFSAESLTYNPWMLALPLALVGLVLGARFLRDGGRGRLLLAAWSLAALWQVKVFACVPLLLGLLAAGLLRRRRRPLALGAAAVLFAMPWAWLSLVGGDPTAPRALRFELLYPVALSLSVHPSWRGLSSLCAPGQAWLVRWPAIAAATLLVTLGGLGVRLLGALLLVRRARHDQDAFWTWLGLSLLAALVLGLTVVGDPLALNGAQFLILPQLLLWLPAGPWLASALRAEAARRWIALALTIAACISPIGYLLRKGWPERFTSPRTVDRARLALPAGAVAAAGWLARQPIASANLLADWRPRAGDPAARIPLYAALLSGRRLLAYDETHSVSQARADERRAQVAELFDTTDSTRAEALLEVLRPHWVWVDTARPLRFQSPRLALRAQGPGVEIHEYAAP